MPQPPLQATEYLADPAEHPPQAVTVAFGGELFLKRLVLERLREAVLDGGDADFSLSSFDGRRAQWSEVANELSTLAMFGGGRRLVIIEDADEFVTEWRSKLEAYVARPRTNAVLLIDAKTWSSGTRLYMAVAESGLQIDCSAPKANKLAAWLSQWVTGHHKVQLPQVAAEVMIDLVGPELGLLDQEAARLALLVPAGGKITAELVEKHVGTWRVRTVWEMMDLALAGNIRAALELLDRLLRGGETPVGVLAQVSTTLRRFAAATRLVLQAERSGRRIALSGALEQAGTKFFAMRKAEQQLQRLGRRRGGRLYGWLLDADLGLKGDSALPPRLVLERLLLALAIPEGRAEAQRQRGRN